MLPRLATPAIWKSIEADAYSYRDAFFAGSYRFIACRIRVRNSNRARSDRVRTRGDRDQAHAKAADGGATGSAHPDSLEPASMKGVLVLL
ncbi:MAG: hypothetical protein K2P74_01390, partial [Nitrosomonas sp.]|nr:hypothetical protein [Nitrosomonas sp.]